MSKGIAFFDFDGTITSKDTMLQFIIFYKGRLSFYLGMIMLSPWLVSMKLKLISKTKAKEKMLAYFFGGVEISVFDEKCNLFIKKKLPLLIRPKAIKEIDKHKIQGNEVVIVTAAISNWMSAWCFKNNLKCVSTNLEVMDQKITGKLNGPNCNDEEKVNRILKEYNLKDYNSIFCYGDTNGDKPMLRLATNPYYRYFN